MFANFIDKKYDLLLLSAYRLNSGLIEEKYT